MPLNGTYSSWEQNKEKVFLNIPLKGVSPSKVDIVVQGFVLKVNFVPYLLDITLSHEIDTLRHKATVKKGELRIELFKKVANVHWTSLEADGNEEEVQKLRLDSSLIDEAQKAELQSQRADAKLAEEKYSLRKQMALDESERNRLDQIKLEEKQAAEKEVYEAFSEMEKREAEKKKNNSSSKKKAVHFGGSEGRPAEVSKSLMDIDEDDEEEEEEQREEGQESAEQKTNKEKEKETSKEENSRSGEKSIFSSVEEQREKEEEEDVRYVPPPRQVTGLGPGRADGKVGISFTPRAFPTPMRESKAAEEEDWVARNRKHLKKHGVLGKNVTALGGGDVSEEDPSWLKGKGDDFVRYGDYRSAINAYSAAIEADEQMTPCYSNRSICYLKTHMFAECVSDCSTAIDLLRPSCQVKGDRQNPHTSEEAYSCVCKVIKLLMRRGAAAAQMGDFSAALVDHKEALRELVTLQSHLSLMAATAVDKEDESSILGAGWLAKNLREVSRQSLESDIEKLETLNKADVLKKEGDTLFADQDLTAAAVKYSEVLAAVPVHVSCLANRSAVKMAQKNFRGCIEDCTAALDLMEADSSAGVGSSSGSSMLETILPPAGGEKRTSWQVKTLLRRGMAYSQLALVIPTETLICLDAAVRDYSLAVSLDPKNENLKSDLNKLMTFRESKRKEPQ